MCGRFTLTHPTEALARLFDAVPGNDLPGEARYNICPTTDVVVVTGRSAPGAVRRLRAMRWGFIPDWYKAPNDGPLIINARSETVASKPAFRAAVRARRCLVIASGFYEWQEVGGRKLPWYFTRKDASPMALAGVWQRWGDLDTVAIVSTAAGPGMQGLHHREAVQIEAADWPLWLGEAGHGAAPLMRPSGPEVLQAHRVDPAVNSNRAEGAGLITPIAA